MSRLGWACVMVAVFVLGPAVPAGAAAGGKGTLTGTVHISPGIDLTPRNNDFLIPDAAGAIKVTVSAGAGAVTYVGAYTATSITGRTVTDTTALAAGTINQFTINGFVVVGPLTSFWLTATASGTFLRVGQNVVATLGSWVTVCRKLLFETEPICGSSTATVIFTGELVPVSGNGLSPLVPSGQPITRALLAGSFHIL